MSHTTEVLEHANQVLIGNYARHPIVMARGEGAHVWDTDGKRYTDLFAGFGGAILGHCHPDLVKAATEQAQKLWHVGNSFHTEPQVEFAMRINRFAFKGQAFFCHSGLEANEAACKLARLRGSQNGAKKWKVISFNQSFHGRSLAMIAATGNPKIRQGFEPAVPGFSQVNLGDLEGLTAALDDEVAAILVEPIQGEGGIHPVPTEFAMELRKICNERKITLIYDEVWTGSGRTGKWFGHQHFIDPFGKVIEPDIMTLGKAVGGGLPVAVMFAKPEIAALLTPGKHGSTLGGNPICMAVAKTIFDVIEHDNLLQNAQTLGAHAISRIKSDPRVSKKVADIRGRGLMLGIELREAPEKVVEKGLERGIIINLTAQKVIRLAPPINISRQDWDQGLDVLFEMLAG